MAKRRMLSIDFIESDSFNRLTPQLQALYLHLNMHADDDGFVSNPKMIIRSIGYRSDALKRLIDRGYLIEFESGVVVISHWLVHNQIRKDRYVKTRYVTELDRLSIIDDVYCIKAGQGKNEDFGIPNDNQTETQYSIDKVSLEKINLDYCSKEESALPEMLKTKEEENTPPSKYESKLSETEREEYRKFLHILKLHFLLKYKSVEAEKFIEYNEKRRWRGKRGESVIDNYERYANEWVNKEFKG